MILAGGRAARLGGADKPGLVFGGSTLLAAVVAAAADAGARRVVVIGPPRPGLAPLSARLPEGLIMAAEEPPGCGPVPALRCGLAQIRAPWTAVLAADLPFLRARHLEALLRAAASAATAGRAAGAVLADDQDQPQWLAGGWRTDRLQAALAIYRGASLHGLLRPLRPRLIRWPAADGQPPPWLDCDTPADLRQARRWHAQTAHSQPERPADADRPRRKG